MLPETKESLLAAIKVMEMQIKTLKTLVENEPEFWSTTSPYTPYPYNPNIPQKMTEITCDSKKTNPSKDIKVSINPL